MWLHSAAPRERAYKNTYDLGKTTLLGKVPQGATVSLRALVDKALCSVTNSGEHEIYFGAVEVNGSGIRFYGDICFVLKTAVVDNDTVVLTSNSYDLVRPPITQAGTKPKAATLLSRVKTMAGLWDNDLPEMTVLKALSARNVTERRLTTGQVSDVVLNDEDYLEVLKLGSFDASDLQEVRVSAADAAAEGQISEQLRLGLCPNLAELQWRKHRRAAVKALQGCGIRTRVITTSGRVRA